MNWEQARRFCASLPGATQDIKWGADLCFCIGGRMFAVTWLDAHGKAQRFSFKVDDHRFLELTDHAGIVPAPYLARARWVQVLDADALTDAQARALLTRSHALVAARLTRAQQRALGLSPGLPLEHLDTARPRFRPPRDPARPAAPAAPAALDN